MIAMVTTQTVAYAGISKGGGQPPEAIGVWERSLQLLKKILQF